MPRTIPNWSAALVGFAVSAVLGIAPLRTAGQAARNSPIRHLRGPLPPLIVARGGNETTAFADQQDRFVRAITATGAAVTDLVVAPRNHFDLPFDLGDPTSTLCRATLARLAPPRPPAPPR